MIVLVVDLHASAGHETDLLNAGIADANNTMQNEPGCIRFDVVQDSVDPAHLWFYEVYRDQAALDKHRNMPHFHAWRATPAEWFAAPIKASVCNSIVMADPNPVVTE